jgi:hypothetical protein
MKLTKWLYLMVGLTLGWISGILWTYILLQAILRIKGCTY